MSPIPAVDAAVNHTVARGNAGARCHGFAERCHGLPSWPARITSCLPPTAPLESVALPRRGADHQLWQGGCTARCCLCADATKRSFGNPPTLAPWAAVNVAGHHRRILDRPTPTTAPPDLGWKPGAAGRRCASRRQQTASRRRLPQGWRTSNPARPHLISPAPPRPDVASIAALHVPARSRSPRAPARPSVTMAGRASAVPTLWGWGGRGMRMGWSQDAVGAGSVGTAMGRD
uniref:Uncharacterized protein n=1 Tax=Arundo donax TaxID=35708 RepID=A0A0A9CFB3_ARUDO